MSKVMIYSQHVKLAARMQPARYASVMRLIYRECEHSVLKLPRNEQQCWFPGSHRAQCFLGFQELLLRVFRQLPFLCLLLSLGLSSYERVMNTADLRLLSLEKPAPGRPSLDFGRVRHSVTSQRGSLCTHLC